MIGVALPIAVLASGAATALAQRSKRPSTSDIREICGSAFNAAESEREERLSEVRKLYARATSLMEGQLASPAARQSQLSRTLTIYREMSESNHRGGDMDRQRQLREIGLRLSTMAPDILADDAEGRALRDIQSELVYVAEGMVSDAETALHTPPTIRLRPRPANPDALQLGSYIRLARTIAEITVDELAAETDKSAPYIRMIERGEKVAAPKTFASILHALGYQTGLDESSAIPTVRAEDASGTLIVELPSAASRDAIVNTRVDEELNERFSQWISFQRWREKMGDGTLGSDPHEARGREKLLRQALALILESDEATLARVVQALSDAP